MTAPRAFLTLAVPVLAAAGLAACGDDDDALATVVEIRPTSFETRPVATNTPDPDAPRTTDEEGRVQSTQTYTVRRGDYLFSIAEFFGVEVDELCVVNGWDPCQSHSLHPGDEVTIPPNALDGSREPDEDEADDDDDDLCDILEVDPEECADGTERPVYEIEQGDFPARVANRMDLTIEQLQEVNEAVGNQQVWNSFPIGSELYLPCDDELEDDDDDD